MRLGDFTGLVDSKGVQVPVYLPGTKTQALGTNAGPGCSVPTLNCMPTALLDKATANLMSKYIPLPNVSGNGYTGFFTGPTNQDEYLGKYDESVSEKDHVAASYFRLKTTQGAYGGGNIPYLTTNSFGTQQELNLSDIHTINATTANQAWFTITRVVGGRVNIPVVGMEDLGSSYTTQGPRTLPQLGISSGFNAGGGLAGPVSNTTFFSLRDMVSLTKGKHTLDVGAEASAEKDPIAGNLYNFGIFNYSTSAPTTTGATLADFVTGNVTTMEQDTPYHTVTSTWYYAAFLQDTYRFTPRLTLNLGLRYDLQLSPTESTDLTATFKPGVQSTKVPSAPLGMLFPGDAGVPRGIVSNQLAHFSPRLGLSWDPFGDGKTAIRAGAGMF
jgi:outer membrane receptor protein involved in Fe transport